MRTPRRTLVWLACAMTTIAVAGCLSPTLPLPPPDEPSNIQPSSEAGLWDIHGNCAAGAMVLIRNERTGVIAGAEDRAHSGRYHVVLPAERCDLATVFEAVDDTVTEGTSFLVREVTSGVAQDDCADAGG